MRRLVAPIPPDRRVRRFAQLGTGLVLYGVTASMLVLAGLGLDPWDVFHQGMSRTFGLGIGTWAIITSVLVLVCGWIPLRQRPGIGTVTNAVAVGLVMDAILAVAHQPHALWARIALLIGGVVGNGFATGFYIGAGLGPGPRDGLSTGIAARGHSMRVVRTTIEGSVLVTGFLLGGTVGVGTVLYAVAIGPITHHTIPALVIGRRRSREATVAPLAPVAAKVPD
ncbi:MAG: membrane protein YczE [Solirubrobacteraceae bacterium]